MDFLARMPQALRSVCGAVMERPILNLESTRNLEKPKKIKLITKAKKNEDTKDVVIFYFVLCALRLENSTIFRVLRRAA
jgi:hypothetical protein